jgi:hypothetical protein
MAAGLGCTPRYVDWGALGTVHVFDAGIIPGGTYQVRLIDAEGCEIANPDHFGPPLAVSTSATGDVVGDCGVQPCTAPQGAVDFVDISSVVDKFRDLQTAPRKARADLINSNTAQPIPDRKVDFVDISYSVDAFRSQAAPLPGPPQDDPCSQQAEGDGE